MEEGFSSITIQSSHGYLYHQIFVVFLLLYYHFAVFLFIIVAFMLPTKNLTRHESTTLLRSTSL